jgi:hypothetical protein
VAVLWHHAIGVATLIRLTVIGVAVLHSRIMKLDTWFLLVAVVVHTTITVVAVVADFVQPLRQAVVVLLLKLHCRFKPVPMS